MFLSFYVLVGYSYLVIDVPFYNPNTWEAEQADLLDCQDYVVRHCLKTTTKPECVKGQNSTKLAQISIGLKLYV